MKLLVQFVLICTLSLNAGAQSDNSPSLQKTLDAAKAAHKNILIQFSGSDWCIPCIRMEKAIYAQPYFQKFADSSLITVHADFPRTKKINKNEQVFNEALAEKFNKQGSFPLTVLLDESGKVLRTWKGYKDMTAEAFVAELRSIVQHVN